MSALIEIPTNGGYWKTKYGAAWKKQIEKVQAKFGAALEAIQTPWDDPTDVPIFHIKKPQLLELLRFLKEDSECGYVFLSDITATDESPAEPRFVLVYNLYALNEGPRIRVKCKVADGEDAPTAIGLWKGADWAERETYDMFGIKFSGHPNLRRILMDYRWEGYPLRKDYPLDGYQLFPDAEAPDPERLK